MFSSAIKSNTNGYNEVERRLFLAIKVNIILLIRYMEEPLRVRGGAEERECEKEN